jgi:hypothetical protein
VPVTGCQATVWFPRAAWRPAIDVSQCATETGGRTFPAPGRSGTTPTSSAASPFHQSGVAPRAAGGDRRADHVPFSSFPRKSDPTAARFTFLNVRPLRRGTFLIPADRGLHSISTPLTSPAAPFPSSGGRIACSRIRGRRADQALVFVDLPRCAWPAEGRRYRVRQIGGFVMPSFPPTSPAAPLRLGS